MYRCISRIASMTVFSSSRPIRFVISLYLLLTAKITFVNFTQFCSTNVPFPISHRLPFTSRLKFHGLPFALNITHVRLFAVRLLLTSVCFTRSSHTFVKLPLFTQHNWSVSSASTRMSYFSQGSALSLASQCFRKGFAIRLATSPWPSHLHPFSSCSLYVLTCFQHTSVDVVNFTVLVLLW